MTIAVSFDLPHCSDLFTSMDNEAKWAKTWLLKPPLQAFSWVEWYGGATSSDAKKLLGRTKHIASWFSFPKKVVKLGGSFRSLQKEVRQNGVSKVFFPLVNFYFCFASAIKLVTQAIKIGVKEGWFALYGSQIQLLSCTQMAVSWASKGSALKSTWKSFHASPFAEAGSRQFVLALIDLCQKVCSVITIFFGLFLSKGVLLSLSSFSLFLCLWGDLIKELPVAKGVNLVEI